MRRIRLAVLLALLACAVVWAALRAHVSDEERVEAALIGLFDAAAAGSPARMEALLPAEFRYLGPPPIDRGDRARALLRFDELWQQVDGLVVQRRGPLEIAVAGALATVRAPLLVRFSVRGGGLVLYRADVVVAATRAGDRYHIDEVEFTDLRPGIF